MNGLDLFSGIGGNTIALREYVNTVAYCEADRHAQSVLLSRMQSGQLKPAPIWDDIRTLSSALFDVPIDIIIAGFPCQDISIAGNGKGLEGERSGLFFEIMRLARELRPAFIFLENVPAIRTRGLPRVTQELASHGYDCRWQMLSAQEIGAPHIRQRWFCLAYSQSFGAIRENGNLACENGETLRSKVQLKEETGHAINATRWEPEPNVARVANGVSLTVDRIKRLGNSVVPKQAKEAFENLLRG